MKKHRQQRLPLLCLIVTQTPKTHPKNEGKKK